MTGEAQTCPANSKSELPHIAVISGGNMENVT
jgi:hypothetical protein